MFIDMQFSRSTVTVIDFPDVAAQVNALRKNCAEFGVEFFDVQDASQGIVHMIGPELGATKPGMTIVCGDSHTSTHGAFGALAFGKDINDVKVVLSNQFANFGELIGNASHLLFLTFGGLPDVDEEFVVVIFHGVLGQK